LESNSTPYVPSVTLWKESIAAIKASADVPTCVALYQHLLRTLPQNSLATRRRYTGYILARFFPNGALDNLPRNVWLAYQDEEILKSVMRYFFLRRERLIGQFIEKVWAYLEPGTAFERGLVEQFVAKVYGRTNNKGIQRILEAASALSFITRAKQGWSVLSMPRCDTALLILLHHLFAPEPRTVTLQEIIMNPFWRYLGLRSEDTVRQILRESAARDVLAKYVVADQLEQITTRYTLDEFLTLKVRL